MTGILQKKIIIKKKKEDDYILLSQLYIGIIIVRYHVRKIVYKVFAIISFFLLLLIESFND